MVQATLILHINEEDVSKGGQHEEGGWHACVFTHRLFSNLNQYSCFLCKWAGGEMGARAFTRVESPGFCGANTLAHCETNLNEKLAASIQYTSVHFRYTYIAHGASEENISLSFAMNLERNCLLRLVQGWPWFHVEILYTTVQSSEEFFCVADFSVQIQFF